MRRLTTLFLALLAATMLTASPISRDEARRQEEAIAVGEQTDWQEAMRQWEEWENTEKGGEK